MELTELFGSEALTYDQFAQRCAEHKAKFADLSGGAYVGKEKYDTLAAERDRLKTRLSEANAKLEGYDPQWKEKAAQAQADADAKIAGMRFDAALSSALRDAKVKNPATLTGLLDRDALKLADGKILGLAEQLESIKKDNGFLFESDEKPPRIVAGAPGAKDVATMNQKANEALRSCFGKE